MPCPIIGDTELFKLSKSLFNQGNIKIIKNILSTFYILRCINDLSLFGERNGLLFMNEYVCI